MVLITVCKMLRCANLQQIIKMYVASMFSKQLNRYPHFVPAVVYTVGIQHGLITKGLYAADVFFFFLCK